MKKKSESKGRGQHHFMKGKETGGVVKGKAGAMVPPHPTMGKRDTTLGNACINPKMKA